MEKLSMFVIDTELSLSPKNTFLSLSGSISIYWYFYQSHRALNPLILEQIVIFIRCWDLLLYIFGSRISLYFKNNLELSFNHKFQKIGQLWLTKFHEILIVQEYIRKLLVVRHFFIFKIHMCFWDYNLKYHVKK